MYGYWFGMNVLWWVFWAILIVAFFAFLTPVPRRYARAVNDPLEILKRRYAAGEITTAEYEERRARLLELPASAPEKARRGATAPPRVQGAVEHRTER
jgi:putative membrane protein